METSWTDFSRFLQAWSSVSSKNKGMLKVPDPQLKAPPVSACVRPLRFSCAFARRELGHQCHDWLMVGVSTGGTKPKTASGLISEL